jgi:hypothetical protein
MYLGMRERSGGWNVAQPGRRRWPTASGPLARQKAQPPMPSWIITRRATNITPRRCPLQLGSIALERGGRAGAIGLLRRAAALRPAIPRRLAASPRRVANSCITELLIKALCTTLGRNPAEQRLHKVGCPADSAV